MTGIVAEQAADKMQGHKLFLVTNTIRPTGIPESHCIVHVFVQSKPFHQKILVNYHSPVFDIDLFRLGRCVKSILQNNNGNQEPRHAIKFIKIEAKWVGCFNLFYYLLPLPGTIVDIWHAIKMDIIRNTVISQKSVCFETKQIFV